MNKFSPSLNCKCEIKLPSVLGLIIQMKACNQESIVRFIDSANNDGIDQVNSEIDYLIKLSIDYEHPDVTAFLLNYKMKNNLYKESDWSL